MIKVANEKAIIGRPLSEWREVWEHDTSKLSELVRNLAFAGIGIIWIFKTSTSIDAGQDLTSQNILPSEFISPLLLIVAGLTMDLLQYLWRAINTWAVYKIKMSRYKHKKISDNEALHATMPPYIANFCWILFTFKIVLISSAYVKLLFLLLPKIYS